MKKQWLWRGLLGFPLGVAVGYGITILISLIWAGGYYAPCVPELTETVGSEIGAVLLQAVLSGLLGTGCGLLSLIWGIDSWSLTRQGVTYFAGLSAVMLPVAYVNCWMEHSLAGFLEYCGIFVGIFVLVWLIRYSVWKRRVRRMNQGVADRGKDA